MLTLRLTQFTEAEDKYRVEVALEGDGLPRQTATSRFDFKLTPQDHEDLRWYLEDYLQYPLDPAPTIAARIEQRMNDIGTELFKAVFHSSDDSRDLWATLRGQLNNARVEINTEVREATAIPWELLRDPKTEAALALRSQAFVRSQPQTAQRPKLPQTASGPIRILLVICRPGGRDDVPFRSVASRLLKSLSSVDTDLLQLDVLRPPTFEQLSKTLRQAKANGAPYHVVHFDGHGTYEEVASPSGLTGILKKLNPLLLSMPRTGAHGYLLFENPQHEENAQFVDGPALGKLLVETEVPVLVLNACRSAHADAPTSPLPAGEGSGVRAEVRAFGSLAQEVMDAGVAGVVAMRYNVYVVTAAQFVADFYSGLTQGQTLGEAVTLSRKQLEAQPLREIAYDPRPLQDWPVPVAYEAAPIGLFPKPQTAHKLNVKMTAGAATTARGSLAPNLPPQPDAGFFGRDETLLGLDRAFDTQALVLLHAFAGSGKTTTAAEFARWYSLTGGVQGPVLFTSFEQYKPLPRVLDQIGTVFGPTLEQSGVHWLALSDADRRSVALQVLKQIPVLWIWDNVEPVAGFPAGTASAWNAAEQKELKDFLSACRDTKAKVLLTSRRDEQAWLGDLAVRIHVPPMPMQERVQLARALAEKHNRRLTEVEDWRPLLQSTQGNPLTIAVLVGQALREGLKTKAQITAFVDKLRAGEANFNDEVSEGRAKSLGASLSYGFEHAFNEAERKQLALLHFFQGFVDVDVLRQMGHPESDFCLPEVRGLTREVGITLLDRAAEVGLLTNHRDGFYSVQPALPWYFKNLFDQYYPPQSENVNPQSPARAFVEAIGELGNFYHRQYNEGNHEVVAALTAEEANLLHARHLARKRSWWRGIISTMQGLKSLYGHKGRSAEWKRLVDEIVPEFVDLATDAPLPGREKEWNLVTQYRVQLAIETMQWVEAERLQRVLTQWARQHAAEALTVSAELLDSIQRNAIRSLAASLEQLAIILREQGKSECIILSEEAIKLYQRIDDHYAEAISALNLGNAYKDIPALRDLEQAEHWYRRSLELRDERDQHGNGLCWNSLGHIARERFREARADHRPNEELLRNLNDAIGFFQRALEMLPANAVRDLAVVHNNSGGIYAEASDFERALQHYREAIRYHEASGSFYGAALARRNIAVVLARISRLADAMDYARAALRGFSTFGQGVTEELQRTQEIIRQIQDRLHKAESKR